MLWLVTGLKKCKLRRRLHPQVRLPRHQSNPPRRQMATLNNPSHWPHVSRLQRLSTTCQRTTMTILLGTSWMKMVSRYFPTSLVGKRFCSVGGLRIVVLWFATSLLTTGMLPGSFSTDSYRWLADWCLTWFFYFWIAWCIEMVVTQFKFTILKKIAMAVKTFSF